jgi:hypothetical protein
MPDDAWIKGFEARLKLWTTTPVSGDPWIDNIVTRLRKCLKAGREELPWAEVTGLLQGEDWLHDNGFAAPIVKTGPLLEALAEKPLSARAFAIEGMALPGWAADDARKRRRGPEKGTVQRYVESDRALFPKLEEIMGQKKISRSAAALLLAYDGKVDGLGSSTNESRAKRLAALHKLERGDRRADGRESRR